MVWTVPSASDVKAGVPALAEVDDASFVLVLELAGEALPSDMPSQVLYNEAARLWVAHEMTMRGFGTSPEAELAQSGTLSSVSDGAVSFTRKASDSDDPRDLTTFGAQYKKFIKPYVMPFAVSMGDQS